eukprot:1131015-Pyramimonas_sp.AAC.1
MGAGRATVDSGHQAQRGAPRPHAEPRPQRDGADHRRRGLSGDPAAWRGAGVQQLDLCDWWGAATRTG